MGMWDDIKGKLFGSAGDDQERARKQLLQQQAGASGAFADQGQGGYGTLGGQSDAARQNLADQASGKLSYSREALRQGMQQGQAAQMSMAASANPQNGPMAARTAMMGMGRLGYGLSGQQALAGIAEQQAAAKAYSDATLQQRQQDLMAAMQGRQNAIQGYGAGQSGQPEKSWIEKFGPAIAGTGGLAAMSDRRLKTEIKDGDSKAKAALEGLRAYAYDYKDEKYGKGRQLGVMAQDLKKAGLGQAVIDTPDGLAVHGAKLAGANTAMLAALAKRVGKLEGGGK